MSQFVTNEKLTECVLAYKDMVYGIALSKTRQTADADDIFQEVFLRLVKYAATIKNEAHLKAWLIRVTLNCCNSHFRSGWARYTTFFDDRLGKNRDLEDYYSGDELADQKADAQFGVCALIDESADEEQRMRLFAAVSGLPDTFGTPVHLHYYEGLPIREVAVILRITENAVKQRLFRAREMLKKKLGRV